MNKKLLIIVSVVIVLILIIGAGVFVALRPKPQVKSQAEIIQDQILRIDTDYRQILLRRPKQLKSVLFCRWRK